MKNPNLKLLLLILSLLTISISISSCSSNNTNPTKVDSINDSSTPNSQDSANSVEKKEGTNMSTQNQSSKRTISDFSFLKYNMDRKEIESNLGKADNIVGSGIPIPQYQLADGSSILLHFSIQTQKLVSAVLYNKDGSQKELLSRKNN